MVGSYLFFPRKYQGLILRNPEILLQLAHQSEFLLPSARPTHKVRHVQIRDGGIFLHGN